EPPYPRASGATTVRPGASGRATDSPNTHGQVPAEQIDHLGVEGLAIAVAPRSAVELLIAHDGHSRPVRRIGRPARTVRAGCPQQWRASDSSSYEVPEACPIACVAIPEQADR